MNVNKWLLNLDTTNKSSAYSNIANDLLSLYIQGIHEIYQIDQTINKSEFIEKVTSKITLKSEKMFVNWLEECGFKEMEQILNLNIALDKTVKSKLNLMIYSMKRELEWSDKSIKTIRPAIMNGIMGLKEELQILANAAKEKNTTPAVKEFVNLPKLLHEYGDKFNANYDFNDENYKLSMGNLVYNPYSRKVKTPIFAVKEFVNLPKLLHEYGDKFNANYDFNNENYKLSMENSIYKVYNGKVRTTINQNSCPLF